MLLDRILALPVGIKRILLLFTSIFLALGIFLFGLLLSNTASKFSVPVQPTVTHITSSTTQTTITVPQAEVKTYVVPPTVTLPTPPLKLTSYTLSANLSDTQMQHIINQFGLTGYSPVENGYVMAVNTTDFLHRGILTINPKTTALQYTSYGTLFPKSFKSGENPTSEAKDFLTQLGFRRTVTCSITYTKQYLPDVTYVECHHGWQALGLPDYSFPGLLNEPANIPLSALSLGVPNINTPIDHSITNVVVDGVSKPKFAGLSRPNDFNTATFVIAKDGRILSLSSSLRMITQEKSLTLNSLLTPQDAIAKIKNNKAQLTLLIPQGSLRKPLVSIYSHPDITTVTATDMTLSYLEKPETEAQSLLVPMYTLRGQGVMPGGQEVEVIATIPALRDGTSFLAESSREKASQQKLAISSNLFVKKAYAASGNPSLQLRTFKQTDVPINESVTHSVPSSSVPSDTQENLQCLLTPPAHQMTIKNFEKEIHNASLSSFTFNVPGLGELTVGRDTTNVHEFYYISSDFPVKSIQDARNAFLTLVAEQVAINFRQQIIKKGITPNTSLSQIESDIRLSNSLTYATKEGDISSQQNQAEVTQVEVMATQDLHDEAKQYAAGILPPQTNIFPADTLKDFSYIFLGGVTTRNDPCYITGVSPSLFLYPAEATHFTVKLPQNTTYTYPVATSDTWHITVFPNGTMLTNEGERSSSLYYEYNGMSMPISAADSGLIVKRPNWQSAVIFFAARLRLLSQETGALKTDVKRVVFENQNAPYLRFSLIPENILNQYLPLGITPHVSRLVRINLLVSPLDRPVSIPVPHLTPIPRIPNMAVEVGARGE